jgi:hypothetical protein
VQHLDVYFSYPILSIYAHATMRAVFTVLHPQSVEHGVMDAIADTNADDPHILPCVKAAFNLWWHSTLIICGSWQLDHFARSRLSNHVRPPPEAPDDRSKLSVCHAKPLFQYATIHQ